MADLRDQLSTALAGRYTIERELGRGGMATVFRAYDVRHDRTVALKVLDPALAAAVGLERFLREIRIAAHLQHPYIVPLFDSGQADGLLFYVMPCVEGESLRRLLARARQLPVEDAVRIAGEVAAALACAHDQGVVHRDVKPENVLLSGGHALLADFGIARARHAASDETRTATGVALGTPAYMSPEQAAGEEVDARADQYALACMVYEMLAGQPPFTGPTTESVVHQHLSVAPRPVTELRPRVPRALAAAIDRALAKSPADRFAGVSELSAALTAALAAGAGPGGPEASAPPPPRSRWRRPRAAAAALVVTAVAIAGAALLFLQPRAGPIDSLAVLPLTNVSGDPGQEYFADGMTEALISRVGRVGALRVISGYSAMRYKGSHEPLRAIAKALQVDAVITGSTQRLGERVLITAELIRPADDRQLWSKSYERDMSDVSELQAAVASDIVREVRVRVAPRERERLQAKRPVDPASYDAYLRARDLSVRGQTEEDTERALRWYRRSIAADSGFAPAWEGLSKALCQASVLGLPGYPPRPTRERAVAAARRAIALDPDYAAGYATLSGALANVSWDWAEQERLARKAVELDPNDAWARTSLGDLLTCLGEFEEAVDHLRLAAELDPENGGTSDAFTMALVGAGRYGEAHREARRFEALNPDWPTNEFLVCSLEGEHARARAEADTMMRLSGGNAFARALRAWVLATAGAKSEASAELAALQELPADRDLGVGLALIHTALGERDSAFRRLERAIDDGASNACYLKAWPMLRPLQSDPRWPGLLARIGLTP